MAHPLPVDRAWNWRVPGLLWHEARPVVQAVFALRFCVGVALAGGPPPGFDVAVALLGWASVTMSVYLLNGASDVEGDRRNGFSRPVASGRLPADQAAWYARGLALLGLALAVARGPVAMGLTVAALALGWAYSVGDRPLKTTAAGTAVASAGGGLLTYAAGVAAAGGSLSAAGGAIVVLLSCWMAFAGASKDLPDVEGDRLAGRRTLPVVLGDRLARHMIAGSTAVLAAAAVVVGVTWHEVRLAAAVLALGALLAVLLLGRRRATRAADRRPYGAFMVVQYLANGALVSGGPA